MGITRTDVLTGQNVGTLVREKDEETGEYRLVPRTKKAPAQIQEQIDAENERAAMYDYRFSGLQDLEKQMAGLSATPEPKTAKAKANRAERIRALQEKINQQIDLVNEVLPPKQEKISQATRVQSAAPSKFMTGTEQSKTTPGFTKQPIVESRTPAPITSEKAVADANAFAERIAAAKATLSYLARHNCQIFVSTHDIELTNMLNEEFDLFHFSETVEGTTIDFDYKMKSGIPQSRNAIRILELSDFPETIITEAKSLVTKIE